MFECSTSFTFFRAIKQLSLNFSWLGRIMQVKELGQGKEWQQTELAEGNEGLWMPISKLFRSILILSTHCYPRLSSIHPPSHVIHSCYSFCWLMSDNWKLLSYGGTTIYPSTTSNQLKIEVTKICIYLGTFFQGRHVAFLVPAGLLWE